jgi:lysine 2,3-aminomutase
MRSSDKTLRTPAQLIARGWAPREQADALDQVASRYAVAIPPALAALIDPSDGNDPIARQFMPDARELDTAPGEDADPIGDDAHSPVEGVVHRYPDRVLLKLVHVCAVYCRFCFRREMVGPGKPTMMSKAALDAALDYVRAHSDIWEVILTGGDPLVLSPRRLRAMMTALAAIDHVKVIRFHTRVPVADPQRITSELIRAMKAKGKAVYVAVHVNHARELSPAARAACARLADAGFPLLAQSVLLTGVNDTEPALGDLMRALVECRIKPYYLHHADLAPGTAHLRSDIARGQQLVRSLRGRYSGLCQPTYVLDIPGGFGKSPIGPNYLAAAKGKSSYVVTDFNGGEHRYPPADCSMVQRHEIHQRGADRQTGEADEYHRDDRVPDEHDVATQG